MSSAKKQMRLTRWQFTFIISVQPVRRHVHSLGWDKGPILLTFYFLRIMGAKREKSKNLACDLGWSTCFGCYHFKNLLDRIFFQNRHISQRNVALWTLRKISLVSLSPDDPDAYNQSFSLFFNKRKDKIPKYYHLDHPFTSHHLCCWRNYRFCGDIVGQSETTKKVVSNLPLSCKNAVALVTTLISKFVVGDAVDCTIPYSFYC